jgi:hypothetical protein
MRHIFLASMLAMLLLLSAGGAMAQGTGGQTCPPTGWCQTWPVTGLPGFPPQSAGWNRLLFDTTMGRAVAWQEEPDTGVVTFSTAWYSYGYLPVVPSSGSPWREEATCGDRGPIAVYNHHGLTGAALTQSGLTFQLDTSACSTSCACGQPCNKDCQACLWPEPSIFNSGEIPAMWIDDEEMQYSSVNETPSDPKFGQVTLSTRGIRGTSSAAHAISVDVFQGCPNPMGLLGNALASITDHANSRHPWRNMAFDGKRDRWWQATGKPENGTLHDTWFYCPNVNAFCPTAPSYTRVAGANAPPRTDSALEYDSDHDVLLLYGGTVGGAETDTTYIYCIDFANPSYGCSAANQWFLVATSCSGTRWDGTACNSDSKPGPGGRNTLSLTYDSFDHRFVLFGGTNDNNDGCPGTSAPPWNGTNCPSEPNDTWVYDVPSRTWTQLTNAGDIPAPTRRPAIAYDSFRHQLTMWQGPTPCCSSPPPAGHYEQGTYALTINLAKATANWTITNVGSGGATQPPPPFSQLGGGPHQANHAEENLAYDPANDVYIFVDLFPPATDQLATWQLPGVSLGGAPPPPKTVKLTPASASFTTQLAGTQSAPQPFTLANTGSATVNITRIDFTGANQLEFAIPSQGTTCPLTGGTLGVGAHCTIEVAFAPQSAGSKSASLIVADDAQGNPHTSTLTGTANDLNLGASSGGSTSATVTAGQTANYNLQVNPVNGFGGAVGLSCDSSFVPNSTCSVMPTSVNVSGAPALFSVMVNTKSNAQLTPLGRFTPLSPFTPLKRFTPYRPWPALLLAVLVGLSFLGFAASRRRLAWGAALAMLLLSLGGCGATGSGGNGGSKGTPPGTYKVTVTASVQGVNRPLKLTLTVN